MNVKIEHSTELVLNIVSWILGQNLLLIDIIYHRAIPSKRGTDERIPGLQTTQEEMEYALHTQRKIPIGRNRFACQSNLIRSGTDPFSLETDRILVLPT